MQIWKRSRFKTWDLNSDAWQWKIWPFNCKLTYLCTFFVIENKKVQLEMTIRLTRVRKGRCDFPNSHNTRLLLYQISTRDFCYFFFYFHTSYCCSNLLHTIWWGPIQFRHQSNPHRSWSTIRKNSDNDTWFFKSNEFYVYLACTVKVNFIEIFLDHVFWPILIQTVKRQNPK